MSNKKQAFVKEITPMEEDFARWYTDVITKTEMVDYAPVKGFMVIRPYGYAIWEYIVQHLDRQLKETGHQNLYFPLLIPESLLNKEAEHIEGFAPEVAWVTHGGNKELSERLCIRPTSEAIICSMYAKWLKSYRDLPYLYNQWCNVVRWEKTTRPFLRTAEFLWQEGHTLHVGRGEAEAETRLILDIYRQLAEQLLAIPVVAGQKSEKEKFAGAECTYTIEALMHDGKALQAGTSHFLGQHFTEAFNICYSNIDGDLVNPYHTSWGVTTRLIGAVIMVHGDNRGLVLPPAIAPVQAVIIPIAAHKNPAVLTAARELEKALRPHLRVKLDDDSGFSPGYKFNKWEMKGVPLRLELGPRDLKKKSITVCRRDTLAKIELGIEESAAALPQLLTKIQNNMLNKALKRRESNTYTVSSLTELQEKLSDGNGLAKAMWCGCRDCEDLIKDRTGATIRCIPFDQENLGNGCHFCEKPARHMVYIAKAY